MKKSLSIPLLYLLLGLLQAAHSVEEILTGLNQYAPFVTGAIHQKVAFFLVMDWSVEGFASANLIIVAAMLALSPFVFLRQRWTWPVVKIIAAIEVIMPLFHIVPALAIKSYQPGVISGVGVLLLAAGLFSRTLRKGGYDSN